MSAEQDRGRVATVTKHVRSLGILPSTAFRRAHTRDIPECGGGDRVSRVRTGAVRPVHSEPSGAPCSPWNCSQIPEASWSPRTVGSCDCYPDCNLSGAPRCPMARGGGRVRTHTVVVTLCMVGLGRLWAPVFPLGSSLMKKRCWFGLPIPGG